MGGRYQGGGFERLGNTDSVDEVTGARDEFSFSIDGHVAFGIDNLTDDTAFYSTPGRSERSSSKAGIRF